MNPLKRSSWQRAILFAAIVGAALVLSACGGSGGSGDSAVTTSPSQFGALSLKLEWDPSGLQKPASKSQASWMAPLAAGDVCANYGIEKIEATVFDSSGTQVAFESWACAEHEGQIDKVPAGSGISVVLDGLVTSGLAWSGQAGNLVVRPGEITQAGTVTMKYIGNDSEPPEILSTAPSHGAEAVPLDSLITIVFSEEMVFTIMVATNFSCVEAISQTPVFGKMSYNLKTRTITFEPDAPFCPLTQYTAVVSKEVEDLAGHTMPADYTWTFYTTFLDTDGDGMPDTWEEAYGLNPLVNDAKQDLDEDGLGNLAEFLRLTLPNNPDTDGDGYNDGREVSQSTDPKDKDSHAGIPDIEAAALRVLYNNTSGHSWYTKTNWVGAVGTECTWFGVGCNEAGSHVTQLDLDANRLSGTIPPEIGDFAHLTILRLGSEGDVSSDLYNMLNGPIPEEVFNLLNLQELILSYNLLTGSIPADIGKLVKLRILDLGGGLKYDEEENPYLGYNQLNGPIPEDIGQLTNLEELNLSFNKLTGFIPASIGNLLSLQALDLEFNQLSGSIPSAIGNLANLEELYLGSNQFTGEIPIEIIGLKANLGSLDISFNGLYTTNESVQTFLDGFYDNWENTQTVAPYSFLVSSVSSSSVTLEWIPIAYQTDPGVYEVEYSTSENGPYTLFGRTSDKSAQTLTVSGLEPETGYYFRIRTVTDTHSYNQNTVESSYSEPIPGTTTFLDTDGDGMPDIWEEAYGLNALVDDSTQDLDEDGLDNLAEYNHGTLPNNPDTDGDGYNDNREVSQSTDPKDKDSHKGIPDIEVAALQAIYTSTSGPKWYYNYNWMGSVGTECSWYGVICDEKENHVTELDLNANRLSGTIPAEIGDLGQLTILLLGNSGDVGGYRFNQLTGDIPAEIGNLVHLTELDFSYNQLSGEIPTEVGELIHLTILDLRVNRLSGPIPAAIGNLVNLTQIVLSSNMLSGPIPDEFLNLKQLGTAEDQYSDLSWNALYTENKDLQNFLDEISEGWNTTQTVAPDGLTIDAYDNSSVTLQWAPIAYQADSGGYEVEFSTSPNGPFTFSEATEDKSDASLTVQKLQPVTLYYFRVRTVTEVHDNNQNTIYSEYSEIISQETEPEPYR